MVKTITIAGAMALACLSGAVAYAQQAPAQEYSYPSLDGSASPPSTLRITEQPGAAGRAASGVVRDSQESLAEYRRCRDAADREAIGHVQLQEQVSACLSALQARRQP